MSRARLGPQPGTEIKYTEGRAPCKRSGHVLKSSSDRSSYSGEGSLDAATESRNEGNRTGDDQGQPDSHLCNLGASFIVQRATYSLVQLFHDVPPFERKPLTVPVQGERSSFDHCR